MQSPPPTSRAALTELERQRALLAVTHALSTDAPSKAAGDDDPAEEPDLEDPDQNQDDSKGAGRKHNIQQNPEDQKGRADPKDDEGRGAR